jgi:hypothetical protein
MNNEFVKVLNKPEAVMVRAAMQMKQQLCTFEILWIPKQSCKVSGMVYVNALRKMKFSVYRTNSIIQWVLCIKNTYF